MKVIDGKGKIVGRVASNAAKLLLNGEKVVIINAERMVMSGDLRTIVEKYHRRRLRKDRAKPEHSQKWPRRPDLFVRRIVRGMLPYDSPRGRDAFKRLRVYIGNPEVKGESIDVPGADAEKLHIGYATVKEICERLGHRSG